MKKILVLSLVLSAIICVVCYSPGYAQRIIAYGFEDWTGNENTAPGYIFSSVASTYWNMHVNSNQVRTQNASCGNKTAHSGQYYIHRQFNTTITDPCLGGVATSIDDHGNLGLGGTYPTSSGDKTALRSAITGNTMTVRYWFRVTDAWKTQTGLGLCKFFRLYGTGGSTDPASLIVHIAGGGGTSNTNTAFHIYDPSGSGWSGSYGTVLRAGADLQDGNWHSVTIVVRLNNTVNAAGNVTARVWFDDWNMAGDPQGERTVTCPSFGASFDHFNLTQNWSATYPSSLMGIDFDDIEVWNGLPSASDRPSMVTGLRVTEAQ
ncbi:MAG: hypothetical protein A4E62_02713 [Syntrophorhabdus sp. PtaU1.Bin002]|nr:MAG: hypothetical protein A4E62_02713 [Syntrophorhabdus sp. PtaU1.Bin002]